MAEDDERVEELGALEAIFPEAKTDYNHFSAILELAVSPSQPLLIRFVPQASSDGTYAHACSNGLAHVERDVRLSRLPALRLEMSLPAGYPSDAPPKVRLTTNLDWLPAEKLQELEAEAEKLWEDFGRGQTLYNFVDSVQQAAERGFDLGQSADGCLVLPSAAEKDLVAFDQATELAIFNTGTYDCGICLEPKKGSSCYKMKDCGHVFCLKCLQDFYINAITEGDVSGIRCLDPACGKEPPNANGLKRKRKTESTLHPRELLAMGIEEATVRRYVEMKRKKKLESDKTTVWCPRTWCQSAAKSAKYPPIPSDLTDYVADDAADDESDTDRTTIAEETGGPTKIASLDPTERLAICEKCTFAFCKMCYTGWHGQFARCFPRDPGELSKEEKASYDYIRANTSPCPTCDSPTQKTMGCNHMSCFQCKTHFCYLCSAWLDGANPYQHFNKPGTPCFNMLWEREEGDEGQADGPGAFAGARRWEQMAIEVAREADAREAEEAAEAAQAAENALAVEHVGLAQEPVEVALAHIHLDVEAPRFADEEEPRFVLAAAQMRARMRQAQIRLEEGLEQEEPHVRAAREQRMAEVRRGLPRGQWVPAEHAWGVRRHEHPNGYVNDGGVPAEHRQGVRRHEQFNGHVNGGRVRRHPMAMAAARREAEERQQRQLQRFLEMAEMDQEDDWDSDGLDENDADFVIPPR
ncbi:hypothetical protein LTR97_003848 [Elasticomyces elasticus]|uniref:RBR-type E3 ubiquitin transferase n=1 Tax=Elasticomyces elasticus TaxID=574655 RepID=A0AAN7ZPD9_9PEZI|nr:hypothetical protein LTR97_003848 [Elasticomyces elasticus]